MNATPELKGALARSKALELDIWRWWEVVFIDTEKKIYIREGEGYWRNYDA